MEKKIAANLQTVLQDLKTLPCPYEVITVVDGTKADKSYKQAKKIKSHLHRVIGYPHNRGKGYAVRFGMAHSRGDVVGFLDSGGDINAKGIPLILEHFRWYDADVIIGSKRHSASKVHYPWQRRILSFVYQKLVWIMFGLNVQDTQVGIKLFKRPVLEKVLPRLIVKKFAFDIEILAVAHHLGHTRIYDAPVELIFPGDSTVTSKNFWKVSLDTLVDTLAVFYRLRILHYYDDASKRKWIFDKELNFKVNV